MRGCLPRPDRLARSFKSGRAGEGAGRGCRRLLRRSAEKRSWHRRGQSETCPPARLRVLSSPSVRSNLLAQVPRPRSQSAMPFPCSGENFRVGLASMLSAALGPHSSTCHRRPDLEVGPGAFGIDLAFWPVLVPRRHHFHPCAPGGEEFRAITLWRISPPSYHAGIIQPGRRSRRARK